MSPYHHELLNILKRCRFLPGSFEKRFVLDLAAEPIEKELSAKQEDTLERIAYHFRAQIHARTGRTIELSDDLKPEKT